LRSPNRNPDGTMTAQAIAGQGVFTRLGCATCHGGDAFTDSVGGAGTLRQVGTLRSSSGSRLGGALTGIDTPTLLGAWATAPYFHDGSAATLDEVFRVAGGLRIPAENGTGSGGISLVNTFTDLNNDDTPRGRAYVQTESATERLTFSNVDGGTGGLGSIELRYTNSPFRPSVTVTVNGIVHTLALPDSVNDPAFRSTNWNVARLDDVALTAGTSNTIIFDAPSWYVSIDEIVVTTAAQRALAAAHRAVLAEPAPDQAALLAYLLQLDRPTTNTLFANGFE
jgi:hypothetical protein